jgi:hypothetical protein
MANIITSKTKPLSDDGVTEGETLEYSLAADALGGLAEEIAKRQEKLAKSKAYTELQILQGRYVENEKAMREGLGYKKGEVANDESTVRGECFVATLGKSSNSTTVIDKKGLVKWIEENFSKEELMELVKFGITDLREYLPKKSFEQFTKTERTGSRKLVLKRHAEDPDG